MLGTLCKKTISIQASKFFIIYSFEEGSTTSA
nr:MAG TPA_asm: hypothetical protein [Caudoviricetes sp.]